MVPLGPSAWCGSLDCFCPELTWSIRAASELVDTGISKLSSRQWAVKRMEGGYIKSRATGLLVGNCRPVVCLQSGLLLVADCLSKVGRTPGSHS